MRTQQSNNSAVQAGDVVTCRAPRGYFFTAEKNYTILEYEPESHGINFTWPAYVRVVDDLGKEVWCHAHRFTKKEAP